MSDAPPPPPPDDVDALLGDLATTTPDRAAQILRALQVAVWTACTPVALTGAVGLVLGLWAWGESLAGVAVVLVATAPAIGLAAHVGIRATRLADAITHPGEVLAQARDLVGRAKDSPELRQAAQMLRGRGARASRTRAGRVRSFVAKGRLVSRVIGLADPDPNEHRLLVGFTPDRLRNLWLAILAGLWWWLAASIVALLGAVALVARALGT